MCHIRASSYFEGDDRPQGEHGRKGARAPRSFRIEELSLPLPRRTARPKLVAVASRDSPHVMLGSLIRLAILLYLQLTYRGRQIVWPLRPIPGIFANGCTNQIYDSNNKSLDRNQKI